LIEQWFEVRITQTKALHNGFASSILPTLKLIEIVDSRLYQNPSLSRVGEELAVHEADNPPFFSQHIVSRGSEGSRIQAERHRPRFLDDTLIRPVRRSTANSPSREPVSETIPWLRLDAILSNLAGRLLLCPPFHQLNVRISTMTGSTWINLLYEIMSEQGLIDSRVDIEQVRELLIIAQTEACFEGDESAVGIAQSGTSH
jgi:hypothetical protein